MEMKIIYNHHLEKMDRIVEASQPSLVCQKNCLVNAFVSYYYVNLNVLNDDHLHDVSSNYSNDDDYYEDGDDYSMMVFLIYHHHYLYSLLYVFLPYNHRQIHQDFDQLSLLPLLIRTNLFQILHLN